MATTFFANHPRYREQFLNRLSEPTDNSDALTRDVLSWIGDDMQIVQAEFNLFATELDYGIEPASIAFDLKQAIQNTEEQVDAPKLAVQGDLGWQLYTEWLAKGNYQIEANGAVQIEHTKFGKLTSEPQGVTLQYYRSNPLGQLIAIVSPLEVSLESTELLKSYSIGKQQTMNIQQKSWLLLRANLDPYASEAVDGEYKVQLHKAE